MSTAGMAGSGKTTLMQRINSHLHMKKTPGYIINLDPAVMKVPYSPNIDIRDTVRALKTHRFSVQVFQLRESRVLEALEPFELSRGLIFEIRSVEGPVQIGVYAGYPCALCNCSRRYTLGKMRMQKG